MSQSVKAQILVITIFALATAMTVLFFLYTPIKTQVLRIKILEFSLKSISKSLSGLEISFFETHKVVDISHLFGEDVQSTRTRVDPIYCGGGPAGNSCFRESVFKANNDWQRNLNFYYLCLGNDCNIKRRVINTVGKEVNIRRSIIFSY